MKSKICYKAQDDVLAAIKSWENHLAVEKRFSAHTVSAYMRDLSFFINYFADKENFVDLDFLGNLDVREFRSFISYRAEKKLQKSSLARQISVFKNFFKWLNKNHMVKNSAISLISSPKLNKVFELKKYEEDYIDGIDGTSYISRNGIVYFIKKEDNDATDKSGDLTKSVAKVTIDINAKNKPNTVGKDIFYYYLGDNGILYPFGGEDVEKAFGETYSCDSTGFEGCAGRLAENGYNMDY